MGISIKNDRAEKLARQVSAETLMAISRRSSSLLDLDTRDAEEILGYDEKGVFG